MESTEEDKASWTQFVRDLKDRGLRGIELFVSKKEPGPGESLARRHTPCSPRNLI